MRPKFVIILLLLAAAVAGGIYFLRPKPVTPSVPPPVETAVTPAAETVPAPAKNSPPAEPVAPAKPVEEAVAAAPAAVSLPPTAVATGGTLTVEERAVAIEKLQDWSTHDATDHEALTNIVAALSSPDAKVRSAAVDATRELGSKDAIPALKAAAAATEDKDEKLALLEAAHFLTLPMLGSPEAAQDTPDDQKNELPATEPTKP